VRHWTAAEGLARSCCGRLPVVVDANSCTLGLVREVVPYLDGANRRPGRRAYHVLHASPRIAKDLRAVTEAVADEIVEPITATCCGFAGDRGFLRRELTESATWAGPRRWRRRMPTCT
jgi:D-lactate dehydrogenase